MANGTYREADAEKVIVLTSNDGGATYVPDEDPFAGSGGGGAGTVVVQEGDVTKATADTIDFNATDFDVTAVGAEANVALSADVARDADVTSAISTAEAYADAAVTTHEAAANPHPTYLTAAEGDAAYDALGAAATAETNADAYADGLIATHEAAANPHPTYLTAAEGDAAYDAINAASDAVTAHVALGDPHTQYALESGAVLDGDTAGGDLSGTYPNPTVVDANIDHGSLGGVSDDDHTRYVDKSGSRTGDQTFEFSSTSGAKTVYRSTSHATKGKHVFGSPVVMGSVAEALAASVDSVGADIVGVFGKIFTFTASDFFTQVAGTNFYLGAVATSNTTTTTCATIPIPAASVFYVKAVILARKTDESLSCKYERTILVRNNAGTITTDQAVTTVGTDYEPAAGYNATLDVSGTDVRVRVTGVAATNIEWTAHVEAYVNNDV